MTQTTQSQHTQANEYKELCAISNEMVKQKNGTPAINGWTKVDGLPDKRTNFKGVLYEKNGQYVMCFVGTDKWSAKDHGANLKMAITGESAQEQKANEFYDKMSKKYNLTPENTCLAGHSEGGTEATYVAVKNGIKTVTFNAYGISKKLIDKTKDYSDLVTNYRDAHDPVSKLKENIGKTYITESRQNKFMSRTPFGSVPAHGIKNMGDCEKAIPVEEYKKSHPLFLDKISEADITREDVGEMPNDLYKMYEKELDNRMSNNDIPTRAEANQKTVSGDRIYVRGYTREDGTEVSGYYRRVAIA